MLSKTLLPINPLALTPSAYVQGISTVRMLRELEERTGRQIHELFDLIVGTSTGGLLAVAVGLRKLSLDECDHIYKVLGQKVGVAGRRSQSAWGVVVCWGRRIALLTPSEHCRCSANRWPAKTKRRLGWSLSTGLSTPGPSTYALWWSAASTTQVGRVLPAPASIELIVHQD